MVRVTVSCPVYPSEDPKKVREAIARIFPGMELEESKWGLKGEGSLDNFSKLIRRQEILDSTRNMLFKGMHGNKTTIRLNKQVATVGKVSFAEPRAILGSIDIVIEDDDLEAVIDRIAPGTVDGREVFH
ncbi:MAG: hypothetical protein KRP56_00395 [Candidatus Methanogranum gryphiswaldense]|nr:MAG: hypothetical protein KRP56_00395 [Candidatus Methanogranum sp. U3.2.1]